MMDFSCFYSTDLIWIKYICIKASMRYVNKFKKKFCVIKLYEIIVNFAYTHKHVSTAL